MYDISKWQLDQISNAEDDVTNEPKITKNDQKENNLSEEMNFSAYGAINDCFPITAPFGINPTKYSSVTKLLRVTAYVRRFIGKMKKKKYCSNNLSARELQEAEDMWIKHVQHTHFPEVYESLVRKKSVIYNYNLVCSLTKMVFLDVKVVWRMPV